MSIRLVAIFVLWATLVAAVLTSNPGCGGSSLDATQTGKTANHSATQKRAFPSEEELFALIKERVDGKRATGIVLGIREADGSHTIVAYGDAGPGANPLGPKSVFEIGSISKVFTGILLADMVARGEVGLEDAVQKHAHDRVTIPSRGLQPIRLVDLAMHMSGLPRLPANLMPEDGTNPYADYTVDQLHQFLSAHSLRREPGEKHEYSNLGVGLLGHVLANVGAKDWESLIRERILRPAGMTMTGITLTSAMTEYLALGHDNAGKVVSNWDMPTLAGAGALRSNAEDMLRFIDANLATAGSPLQQAMQASHTPRFSVGPNMEIGLNWFTTSNKGGPDIVWHSGGTGGYRTVIAFDPKRQIGIVVLENSTHGSDDLAIHLIDKTIPLTKAPKVHKEVTVAAAILADYVGVYQLGPAFHLSVILDNGALYTQATNQPVFPIFAESDTDFFVKEFDAQLSFIRDHSGKVTELVFHQNGKDVQAKRLAGEEAKVAIEAISGKIRKEVPVATSVLSDYVGVYELTPSFKLTITRKADTLQAQATDQPIATIFAESESKFFFKIVDAQISFVRGSDGKVTSLVLHQGGMDQTAAKTD